MEKIHFVPHHRIPVHAERVFSGIRSEIYQWDQKMYDGTSSTFEMVRFLDGAFTIAITPDHRILLTKQEQPAKQDVFLGLPGGSFDSPLEDTLECAQRELLEETGFTSKSWKHWHTFEGSGNVATFTHFFIARDVQKVQEICPDRGEKIELFSISFDEFLLLSSDVRFHHHWSLIPILYEARIDPSKKEELRKIFFDSV